MRRAEIGVLSLAVPPQVDLPLESSSAQLACERLESRVLPRVRYQIATLRERLATYLTLVRLFTCDKVEKMNIINGYNQITLSSSSITHQFFVLFVSRYYALSQRNIPKSASFFSKRI